MTQLTHEHLEAHLQRLESKLDHINEVLTSVRIELATHKAKTSWIALGGSALVSLLIGLGAIVLR